MTPVVRQLLLGLLGAVLLLPAQAETPDAPYPISVWARVLFGPDGRPLEYSLVDEDTYPIKFAENVKARVAHAVVPAPQLNGKPVTLRSGVELRFVVSPNAEGGGAVRLDGVSMGPMPTKTFFASYPTDGQSSVWAGQVTITCTVGVSGRCTAIEVPQTPGMPEAVRRFARVSFEQWEFEPQQLDGQPVEGTYSLRLRLSLADWLAQKALRERFLGMLRRR
ncbi:MAG: energy transducer TonB [Burkholderiales bacterium]|nr:energy transducer TonB [Burkholderiales bacterium]